ncbi:MAG: FtsX-like permease family protein [Desulfobacteraceae bacterium]|nr:FtsX-like permease family protein [Desulfobacteraceae bacterium]
MDTVSRLALRDYFHERLLSICAVLGLAAVLAPLLVLFGLKNGIINTLADRLITDPRNMEISPVGSGRYTKEWFEAAAKMSRVSFVIPQTRSIAANMVLVYENDRNTATLGVDLIPTGPGDPVVEKWGQVPVEPTGIVLSASAAQKLGVDEGITVSGRIGRTSGGRRENVTIRLTVVAVLPIGAFPVDAAFIRLALLEAIEDYRDGFGSDEFGWPGNSRADIPRTFPSFRMYARNIYDVSDLRDLFTAQGVEVYTKAAEIDVVRNLDRSFTLIFRLIAVVAVFGYFASMASNVLANVNRKSRHLGIIRLIGFSTRSIMLFPMVQAVATGVAGTLVAMVLYLATGGIINRLFTRFMAGGEYVCDLSAMHMGVAFLTTLAMSALASAFAAYRVARIQPSEVIRDV